MISTPARGASGAAAATSSGMSVRSAAVMGGWRAMIGKTSMKRCRAQPVGLPEAGCCAVGTVTKRASTQGTSCAMSARKKVPMPDHREIRQWDWALKAAWRVTNEESYMEHSVNSLTRAVACLLRRERARAALELESLRNIAHAVGNKLNEGGISNVV